MLFLEDVLVNDKSIVNDNCAYLGINPNCIFTANHEVLSCDTVFVTSAGLMDYDKLISNFYAKNFKYGFLLQSALLICDNKLDKLLSYFDLNNITRSFYSSFFKYLDRGRIDGNKFILERHQIIIEGSPKDFERDLLKFMLLQR